MKRAHSSQQYLLVSGHGGTVFYKYRVKNAVQKAQSVHLADMVNNLQITCISDIEYPLHISTPNLLECIVNHFLLTLTTAIKSDFFRVSNNARLDHFCKQKFAKKKRKAYMSETEVALKLLFSGSVCIRNLH